MRLSTPSVNHGSVNKACSELAIVDLPALDPPFKTTTAVCIHEPYPHGYFSP
jgi:hypothetical protein